MDIVENHITLDWAKVLPEVTLQKPIKFTTQKFLKILPII